MRSRQGLKSCWGRLRYRSVFRNKMAHQYRHLKKRIQGGQHLNAVDYTRLKSEKWDDQYRKEMEKDETSRFYSRS